MTPLRQRMIEEMHLRNSSKYSIAAYVSAVYRLANHYGRRPDRLSREEIRAFLVDLVEARSTCCPAPSRTPRRAATKPVAAAA
jgi:hypothetical protein